MSNEQKKEIEMFEEDFFEAEELQTENDKAELKAEIFDICKYIRASK